LASQCQSKTGCLAVAVPEKRNMGNARNARNQTGAGTTISGAGR
jgi:hypothetical protein